MGLIFSAIWGLVASTLKSQVLRPMLRRIAARSGVVMVAALLAACGCGLLLAALTVWLIHSVGAIGGLLIVAAGLIILAAIALSIAQSFAALPPSALARPPMFTPAPPPLRAAAAGPRTGPAMKLPPHETMVSLATAAGRKFPRGAAAGGDHDHLRQHRVAAPDRRRRCDRQTSLGASSTKR